MVPAAFEPTIPASERPQTRTSVCAATGIDILRRYFYYYYYYYYYLFIFVGFSLTSVHKSPKDYRCYKQFIRYAHNGSNLVPLETGQAVFFFIVASRAPAELQTEPLANRCSSYRNP